MPPKLRWQMDMAELGQRLKAGKRPHPTPVNTPQYRAWLACRLCVEELIREYPPDRVAFITITTNQRVARDANTVLSKILNKIIGPQSIAWVRAFHRSKNGYVHWHLVAALRFPVLATVSDAGCHDARSAERCGFGSNYEKVLARDSTPETLALTKEIKRVLRKHHFGSRARIEQVRDPDHVANYVAEYLLGAHERGRWSKDRGLRLWAASKRIRVANAKMHVITPMSRLMRCRMAAYCFHNGWKSMEEARRANPRWQFHSREFLAGIKLRTYIYEEDFILDWGGRRWSPKACGVRILQPNSARGMAPEQYWYQEPPTDAAELAIMKAMLDAALPLPPEFLSDAKS